MFLAQACVSDRMCFRLPCKTGGHSLEYMEGMTCKILELHVFINMFLLYGFNYVLIRRFASNVFDILFIDR